MSKIVTPKSTSTMHHTTQHGVNLIAMMMVEPRNHQSSIVGATFYLVGASVLFSSSCIALSLPRTSPLPSFFNAGRGRFNDSGSGAGAGGGRAPPPWNHLDFYNGGGDDSDDDLYRFGLAHFLMSSFSDEDVVSTIHEHDLSSTTDDVQPVLRARGGGAAVKKKSPSSNKNIANSVNDILDSLQNMVLRPFQIVGKNLPSLGKKKSDTSAAKDQEQVLRSTTIQSVTVPASALLPQDIITQSASDAKLIGGTLNPESLELTATAINRWYADNGYVLNSVTGATLIPAATDDDDDESSNEGRVELKVKEVKISNNSQKGFPVKLRFVERVDDNEIEMNDQRSLIPLPVQSTEMSQPKKEHQSFKVTSGVTRPKKIARMTMLEPGSHFRILPSKWSKLVAYPGGVFGAGGGRSAIFSQIHAVRPIPEETSQGDVSVEIVASENKPYTALEYGLTKSLYNDKWEGEFDLKNTNAFGGGEVAAFNVRKGHSNRMIAGRNSKRKPGQKWARLNGGPLSWRMSIKDNYAGYDLNLFQDNVGGNRGSSIKTQQITAEDESKSVVVSDEMDKSPMRIGATMRFRLPPSMKRKFKASVVSATFERINEQSIASTSVGVGPVRFNPLHSLQSFFSASITSGVRSQSNRGANTGVVPYAAGTCTSHQIIPLGSSPANFALRHVASGGTKYIPRHEAIALGLSSKVRGYNYNYQSQTTSESLSTDDEQEQGKWHALKKFVRGGNSAGAIRPSLATSKALSGTVELRVPFMAPSVNLRPIISGTFLFFGDWSLTRAHTSPSSIDKENTPLRCSSAGVGLRKVVQGVPIKVDACITEHGTRGVFFGIGGHEFV